MIGSPRLTVCPNLSDTSLATMSGRLTMYASHYRALNFADAAMQHEYPSSMSRYISELSSTGVEVFEGS